MSPTAIRGGLAVLVTVVLGAAILGIGLGEDEASAPAGTAATGATEAVRVLGAAGERGRELFRSEGCAGCHALAEAGSNGRIGPNLDVEISGEDAASVREDIVDPGAGMPDRYGDLPAADLDALVRYLVAATGR